MTTDETNKDNPDGASDEAPAETPADKPFVDDERTQPAVGIGPLEPASDQPRSDEAGSEKPSLEEQLAQAREETKTVRERMLRVAADFENFRKRTGRELEDVRRRATQEAVKVLLPVFDNLERATAHLDEAADARSMAEGIQMVHRQFVDTLAKLDIERIPAVGVPFDPTVHESIQYEHSDEHPAGSIMTELQPGYRMGEMLLRPSLVVVSRGAAEASAEGAPAEPASDEPSAGGDPD